MVALNSVACRNPKDCRIAARIRKGRSRRELHGTRGSGVARSRILRTLDVSTTLGARYFTTCVETPEGDPRLVEIVCEEMNVPVDPTAEETKGGSGHVAKMLLSASDAQFALVRSSCLPASWHSCRSGSEFESLTTAGSSFGSMQKQRNRRFWKQCTILKRAETYSVFSSQDREISENS